jgi:hypothetical protein
VSSGEPKKCTDKNGLSCGRVLPLSEFYSWTDSEGRVRYYNLCCECKKASRKRSYRNEKDSVQSAAPVTKSKSNETRGDGARLTDYEMQQIVQVFLKLRSWRDDLKAPRGSIEPTSLQVDLSNWTERQVELSNPAQVEFLARSS